jgi:WhiB family redox-sensing transcriptional regulator
MMKVGALDKALCVDVPVDLFFPEEEDPYYDEQVAAAKAICALCECKRECLEFAIATGSDYGIFGGTTPKERRVAATPDYNSVPML